MADSTGANVYWELGSKDLSTYVPVMANGSLCQNTQVPSACKLVGTEQLGGRMANKWDVWNPRGFHVYYWTDDKLAITLRCEIGSTLYEVKNLRDATVEENLFELPAGYRHYEGAWKP
jgi:hypothetical protein